MNSLADVDATTFLGEEDGCFTPPYNPAGTPGARDAAWPERTGVKICDLGDLITSPTYTIETWYLGKCIYTAKTNASEAEVNQALAAFQASKQHGGTVKVNGQNYNIADLETNVHKNPGVVGVEPLAKTEPTSSTNPEVETKPFIAPVSAPTLNDTAKALIIGGVALGVIAGYLAYRRVRR